MRRGLVAAVLACVALSGCGNTGVGSNAVDSREIAESAGPSTGSSGSAGASEDTSDATAGPTIEVEIEGDSVKPNGARVQVDVGQTVTLRVKADHAGEIHVHSNPEQELEYDRGETTLHLTIDKPGIVDVEDHGADTVIAQLEVS
jgi:plastocyanin